jgi:hypothetical protein
MIPVGRGRWWGNGMGGWLWYKYWVHMYVKEKIILVDTISGMRGEEDKG